MKHHEARTEHVRVITVAAIMTIGGRQLVDGSAFTGGIEAIPLGCRRGRSGGDVWMD
ncbi:MAG TPA: hypothetical protein VEX66_09210 [Microlunatus sp.]|nr:hypothetical protein [Microlunatus sp.]